MKTMKDLRTTLAIIATLALGACASATPYPPNPNVASSGNTYASDGVLQRD
jgi:hypothetical protein